MGERVCLSSRQQGVVLLLELLSCTIFLSIVLLACQATDSSELNQTLYILFACALAGDFLRLGSYGVLCCPHAT